MRSDNERSWSFEIEMRRERDDFRYKDIELMLLFTLKDNFL